MKAKALWIFLGTIALTVGSLLLYIQSKSFAEVLKQATRKYMPSDFGVEGDFEELAVKLIPPGVVIKKPSVVLKEKNPANLPAGTKLDAQFIDVTFQFFQLMTGSVNINAFAIHGATLKLDLNEKFFELQAKQNQPIKKISSKGIWDSLVRFSFRSVSLVDSQIDLRVQRKESDTPIEIQTYAKELTIGRSTIDRLPSYDIAIDLQRAMIATPAFRHSISQLQTSIEVSSVGVSIRNLSLQEGELNLHANGQVKGNVFDTKPLKSDISYTVRGPLNKWFDPEVIGSFVKFPKKMPTLAGSISIDGKAQADLLDIERTLDTRAEVQFDNLGVDGWQVDKGRLKLALKGPLKTPQITMESADFTVGDGHVKIGKLSYDPTQAEDKAIRLSAEFDNADFRKLMGPLVDKVYPLHMRLNGLASAVITPGDDFSIEGTTDLKVREFSFDNQRPQKHPPLRNLLSVPEIAVKSSFSIDSDGFSFDKTELSLPRTKLNAHGTVDSDGFNIDVLGPINAEDIGKLAIFDITGEGNLHWTITGKLPDILFTFEADLKNASYLNLNLGNVKGKLVYNDGIDTITFYNLAATQGRSNFVANGTVNVGKTDIVDMDIQVPNATIADFSTVFSTFLKKAVPWYPYELTGQLGGNIKVSGKTDMDQLSIEGDMALQNIDYHHELFRSATVHAGFRRGAYIAENLNIRKKNGLIKGNLNFGADEIIKYDLHSEGLTSSDIDQLASLGIPYRAPWNFDAQGLGKIGSLKSSFKMSFGDGIIKNFPVSPSEIKITTENRRLHGEFSIFGKRLNGSMDWGFETGAASSLVVEANQFDYKPILVALNSSLADDPELTSETSGKAHLKFQTGALSKFSGDIDFSSYYLARKGYSLSLASPVHIDVLGGNYQFENARLVGEGSSLVARGRAHDGLIDYTIDGNLNLGIFEFLVEEIASVRGSVQVTSRINGHADDPNFVTHVVSSGADLRLRDIEQPFEDLKFNVDWRNTKLDISDIASKFAGGMVTGDGEIQLYSNKFPDLDFRMSLDNPKVKVYPVVYARTSGKLNLKGSSLPLKVSGKMNVAEAMVKENFSLSEGSKVLRSSKFLPQKNAGGSGDIQLFDLDLDIAFDRNVFVRNDLLDAEVRGNIKVVNSIQSPRLVGNISVLHGRVLFKDNFFVVQSGEVRFTNPAALDPEFDLTGQTDIKGYKVSLAASGSVSDYKLLFQSQPPLSQNDIVSLLTIGVTSSEYQSISRESRDAYSRDEMYGLIFNQSGVNKGLQDKLGLKVKVDQSQAVAPENVFRARSSDAVEGVSPKVVVQKEIVKNLNASVGSTVGVGDNTERNASLEYQLPFKGWRNFSVIGVYDDQSGPQLKQSRTSVGADLKYRLRFK